MTGEWLQTIFIPGGYVLTAVPVVACLLQYLNGSCRRPGVWRQAAIVDPERLLQDIERMGVSVEIIGNAPPRSVDTERGTHVKTRRRWSDFTPAQKAAIAIVGMVQVLLLVAALVDLRRRPAARINGNKKLWVFVSFIDFFGPIAYFLFGRKKGV
jgi:hypothetical protein